ncbi:hypothetical protein MRX96_024977 [Rhipicephalus microplus]
MSSRASPAPVPWSVPLTEVSHHPTQRAGIHSSNKYLSFWLLGSLSITLLLLLVLLGYCSRRVAHRRATREQAHVLPGASVAPRAGRYLRPPQPAGVPPPPYSPRAVTPSNTSPGAQSHL